MKEEAKNFIIKANNKIITKERNRGGIIREKRKKIKMRKKN